MVAGEGAAHLLEDVRVPVTVEVGEDHAVALLQVAEAPGRGHVLEDRALRREGVDRRRDVPRVAVAAQEVRSHRVDRDEDDVLGRGVLGAAAGEENGERRERGGGEAGRHGARETGEDHRLGAKRRRGCGRLAVRLA